MVLPKLTLEEKYYLTSGDVADYSGVNKGIERLGIPETHANDGPSGFRPINRSLDDTSTQYPSSMHIAATWDPIKVNQWA
jgi:beta-glucosidase-like glycosyl hydrolase